MIEFWINFIIALLMGWVTVTETSSMTSDNPIPQTQTVINFPGNPLGEWDPETYFIIIENGEIVNTGP